jgi:hypothetical protein
MLLPLVPVATMKPLAKFELNWFSRSGDIAVRILKLVSSSQVGVAWWRHHAAPTGKIWGFRGFSAFLLCYPCRTRRAASFEPLTAKIAQPASLWQPADRPIENALRGPKMGFWGQLRVEREKNYYSEIRQTTLFEVLCTKIGSLVFAVGVLQEVKKVNVPNPCISPTPSPPPWVKISICKFSWEVLSPILRNHFCQISC